MEIKTETRINVLVLALNGRFDAHQVSAVKERLDAALKESPNIVIDLAEVGFMDSAALATLVQGMKYCRQQSGDLRICNLQQPVRVIFELTRLDKAFQLFESQAAAIESF